MERPTQQVEFETMLLGRHSHLSPRGKREGGLDRSAYILLSRLGVEGPMTIGQLSEAFGLDTSTLNRQTAAMTRAGLVERIPDEGGGIARKFRVTDQGGRALERERAEIVAGLETVLDDWSEEDVAAFAGYLQRFNGSIERISGRPWPRP
ncbi:MarR family winged helix-turn-helix transcriptional regulator [Kitasatospora sp. NPDC051853]|uniref:MarR family winged helix-turn-helix transcriptional regulator n=1 Tax=Kitasatospora sp. NPDC051853 TaxID=3364058 RepID=UPI003789FF72